MVNIAKHIEHQRSFALNLDARRVHKVKLINVLNTEVALGALNLDARRAL
jgi:hypothetical protein